MRSTRAPRARWPLVVRMSSLTLRFFGSTCRCNNPCSSRRSARNVTVDGSQFKREANSTHRQRRRAGIEMPQRVGERRRQIELRQKFVDHGVGPLGDFEGQIGKRVDE